jgi:hypothetical protein
VQRSEAAIQGRELPFLHARKFGKPSVGNLTTPQKIPRIHPLIRQIVSPPDVFAMSYHGLECRPRCRGAGVLCRLHVQAEQCSLGDRAGGEVTFTQCCEPAVRPLVMQVALHRHGHQNIPVEQPSHLKSSSSSAAFTISAVIGVRDFTTGNPLRVAVFGSGELPGKDRLKRRLTAALIVQSSAFAKDFAKA